MLSTIDSNSDSLLSVYEGWDGYQHSLVQAVVSLTTENLLWRPAPQFRTVGELIRHIALGRINWFLRMEAPGSQKLARQISDWQTDATGNRYITEEAVAIAEQASDLIMWLQKSWDMIDQTLKTWSVEDLKKTYLHTYNGTEYAVSHQWTIWRIMSHDIHHGGQLVLLLRLQGIEPFELGDLGGHIIEPPRAK